MIRRSFLKATGTLAIALALAGCGYRGEKFRYRMTLEVDTPQGLRTGSSVIEVKVTDPGRGPWVFPEEGTKARVRGEAPLVVLPNGRVLFALLSKPGFTTGAEEFPYEALKPSRYRGEYGLIERTKEMKGMEGIGVLPPHAYPKLVTFGDLSDPTSVKEVDRSDLGAEFGEGISLRRITVQMTDDPVSGEIKKAIPWIALKKGPLKKVPVSEYIQKNEPRPLYSLMLRGEFLKE